MLIKYDATTGSDRSYVPRCWVLYEFRVARGMAGRWREGTTVVDDLPDIPQILLVLLQHKRRPWCQLFSATLQ